MKKLNVMFKPTYRCNLRCTYCYAEHSRQRKPSEALTDAETQFLFSWLKDYCILTGVDTVHIVWHGGEPLLMGIAYMEKTVQFYMELLQRHGIQVKNILQTNLTYVEEGLISLVTRYFEGQLGFSLDYNSSLRKYPNGENAFADALENARRLKQAGIRVGAIMMCSQENVDSSDNILSFFMSEGISFRLNRLALPQKSSDDAKTCVSAVSPKRYAQCVNDLIDQVLDNPKYSGSAELFANATEAVGDILHGGSSEYGYEFRGSCVGHYLSVGPGGDIFTCARFSAEEDVLGNYFTETPDVISKRVQEYTIKCQCKDMKCTLCEFQNICRGGCAFLRFTGGHADACMVTRLILGHVKEKLEKLGLSQGCLSKISKEDLIKMRGHK